MQDKFDAFNNQLKIGDTVLSIFDRNMELFKIVRLGGNTNFITVTNCHYPNGVDIHWYKCAKVDNHLMRVAMWFKLQT